MARSAHETSRRANGVLMGLAMGLLVAAAVLIFAFGSWLGLVALVATLPLVILSTRQRVEGQDDPLV